MALSLSSLLLLHPSIVLYPEAALQFYINCGPPAESRVVAAGANIGRGICPLVSVGLFLLVGACSSGVDLRTINPRVIRDSTCASYQWDLFAERLQARRSFQARHRRRCASASAGSHIHRRSGSASSGLAMRAGAGRSVRRDHGSGGWSSVTTTEDCPQFEGWSYRCQHMESVWTRAKNSSGSTEAAVALCLWDASRAMHRSLVSVTNVQTLLAATCSGSNRLPTSFAPLISHQPGSRWGRSQPRPTRR